VDSSLNFTIQALPGIPTTFNTSNNTTQAGIHGIGGSGGGSDGMDGSALGNSIFLRTGSTLTFIALDPNDLLTLGEQVTFTDDTSFGLGGTGIQVTGNGTIVYNGTTDYQGSVMINNANFKVNGQINEAPIFVCRNISLSQQRGMLSGIGALTGDVFVNSGTISPDTGGTLTLGSLILNPADTMNGTLGSLVHIDINSSGNSLVSITGSAELAGVLEIELDPSAIPGTYTVLTSSGITGTFDFVTFTGLNPNYTLTYNPTFVQLELFSNPSPPSPPPPPINPLESPSNLQGKQNKNNAGFQYELYNQLTWTPSPSTGIIGYFIYRDGKKIATVDPFTYTYIDHNRKKGISYTYAITAVKLGDIESSPINIVVKAY
jgi:hypothetical protein